VVRRSGRACPECPWAARLAAIEEDL
jgi:hypothetical protein